MEIKMLCRFLFVILALFAFTPGLTFAGAPHPFDAKAFADAQARGEPILLHIEASWCPTCARQRPILAALAKTPEFQDLVVFNIDFDNRAHIIVRRYISPRQALRGYAPGFLSRSGQTFFA